MADDTGAGKDEQMTLAPPPEETKESRSKWLVLLTVKGFDLF